MSQVPPPPPQAPYAPPPQPSYTGPVLVAAVGAAVMFTLPVILAWITQQDPGCMNCCATFGAASLGVVPVIMLQRFGGFPTAGTGCVIGFFGVGIGGLVGAILQAWAPGIDLDTVRAQLEASYDLMIQLVGEDAFADIDREQFIDQQMKMRPWVPLMFVAFSACLGGGLGMLVAMRRRRPPQQPPWPQYPYPPQQPPQQPPQPPQV